MKSSGPTETATRLPSQPVSIAMVAELAGVSVATVSRVINGQKARYSAATEAKVRDAIAALGYRPAGAGRALRQGESRLVAVIAANLLNPAIAAIAASTEVALRKAGKVMVLCDAHDESELQDEYLAEMRAHVASAFVMLGAVKSPGLQAALDSGQKIVFVNRKNPLQDSGVFVGIDNFRAGGEVADLLYAEGCRHVALLHGSLESSATGERVSGFRRRWQELDPTLQLLAATPATRDHLQIGYQGMKDILASQKPDALFCLSDLIAYGASRCLTEAGWDLSDGIRIIGFDDSPLNEWIVPWLSSVRVPYQRYGEAISQAIQEISDGVDTTGRVIEHRIVRRF